MADTAIEWAAAPRTVDPRGYVLVRLPDHPRADVRGYVYEHLLVFERGAGRPLAKGERVRHVDGNTSNNDLENLRLWPALDRIREITCACGCGQRMTAIDPAGRQRSYVSGHNPVASPTRDAIMAAVTATPTVCLSVSEIVRTTGTSGRAVRVALSKLYRLGRLERPRVGYYRLPGSGAFVPPAVAPRPKHELGAGLSGNLKEGLSAVFGGLCAYGCGRSATTWDHLIPWSLGGSFRHAGNAVPACGPCNSSKNDSSPGPWVARAIQTGYSSDAMTDVLVLAVSVGGAAVDDLFDPELDGVTHDGYPREVAVA
jgi:5-methylcytosine-specific restriction endonuclease McrA